MAEAFQYVRELADRIGPRPATTDAESEAADYIQGIMSGHGLEVERQEFECPRTYSWSFVVYHALTIIAAGAVYFADFWGPLKWVAFAVAALVAFTMWMDLDTRGGLSTLLGPKGPSQNIIGKRVPKARRGERRRKIVIVAHYDTATASLAFAPSMVKNFAATFGLMKWCTFLVPVLILLDNLPFLTIADPYLTYFTILIAAYLLVPLLFNVHREFFMHATEGANDNASGVAAMLGVLDRIAPAEESGTGLLTQPIRTGQDTGVFERTAAPAKKAPTTSEMVEAGGLLEYSPADVPQETVTELPDDFRWAESVPATGQSSFELDTVEFEGVDVPPVVVAPRAEMASVTSSWGEVDTDFDGDGIPDVVEPERDPVRDDEARRRELFGTSAQQAVPAEPQPSQSQPSTLAGSEGGRGLLGGRGRGEGERPKRKGFFGLGRKKERENEVSEWLGVEDGFDARDEGRKIGSWDSFDDEDAGFKGGWAGDDPIGDPQFAANEASRIRKRVAEGTDHSLAEKEVWFVATGAEESGTWGMRAFLQEHESELRGAFIINIDNIGAGNLYWITKEGMARRYASDRRLMSAARKVSREDEILVKGREYKGLSTDATPALARKFKAMSIMAFDINGRLPNWHWRTDTSDNVQAENVDNVVRLVEGIIREL